MTNGRTSWPTFRPTFAPWRDRCAVTVHARPGCRTLPQLVAAVTAEGDIDSEHAEAITRAVVAVVRELAPEEARDVAAGLPAELRELWETEPAR